MTADRKQFNRKVTNKVSFTLSNVQFKNMHLHVHV